ncbi:MAG: aldehyde dehydrogenase family protein [Oceanococcus sp.]|nr:MAG: aldehyde dehydrogenase family protein [Oceanococcus sp.]
MSAVAQDVHPKFESAMQADIQRVFALQQQKALALRSSNKTERVAKLKKLRDAILSRQDAIQQACYADFKKPPVEVDLAEITPILAEIKHSISHIGKWMRGERVWPTMLMFGTKTRIRYEPKGVSLIIAPWNYPINLTLMPLVSAIAAGCTAMIKPSEMTPHCSAVLRDIINDVFHEDEVAMFEGEVDVSTALLELPFDHIFFTGSPAVGKVVMAAAAKHLTSVTLELGGKSPVIVDESADIKKAAQSVMWGKFSNCGQTCIAPDYLYVHESVKDAFIKACREQLEHAYGKDTKASPDFARVVNARHYGRIKSLMDEALDNGATLLAGGDTDSEDNFIAPTLIGDIPDNTRIMEEEIFGPVLPVLSFNDINQVVQRINAAPKPLALYIYTKNPQQAERVLTQTSAGGSCINSCVVQYLHINAPFGGVNNSGIGNSHGVWGFKAFSHERTVIENKFSVSHWLAPPYNNFVKRMIAITLATFK